MTLSSNITPLTPFPSGSAATTGLFNRQFQAVMDNIASLWTSANSIIGNPISSNTLRPESGNTISAATSTLIVRSIDSGGAVFNVRAFGAVGDGVADDTSAFTKALAAANPTNNASEGVGFGSEVYAPPGVYLVSSILTIPTQTRLVGGGRRATTIRASSAFTFSDTTVGKCAVARLTAFGSRIEHLSIDCNSRTSSVGIFTADANEQSGAFHTQVYGFTKAGVYVESASATIPAQTYEFDDMELYIASSQTTGAIGLYISGNANPPRRITGITVNSQSTNTLSGCTGFSVQNAAALLFNCHAEHVGVGYDVGGTTAATGSELIHCSTAYAITGAYLGSSGGGMNSYIVQGMRIGTSVLTVLKDNSMGQTLTGSYVPIYAVGGGATPMIFSDSTGWRMPPATLNLATNNAKLSMRTIAASQSSLNMGVDEVLFSIQGASGASLAIRSGGTIWIFGSSLSTKG